MQNSNYGYTLACVRRHEYLDLEIIWMLCEFYHMQHVENEFHDNYFAVNFHWNWLYNSNYQKQ